MPLTPEQRASLWNADESPTQGHIIVSARPGTGKTTTVTDYCIDLVAGWNKQYAPWQGMALLSYTNVAKAELEHKIRRLGKASELLSAPHFVGTIDSFLNQHLFLPFGAKGMGCTSPRPKLVGEPYGTWHAGHMNQPIRKNCPKEASSPVFFDCYSVDADDCALMISGGPRQVSAGLDPKFATKVTTQNSARIVAMKKYIWRLGYAVQSDANYLSYKTLVDSPLLTQSLLMRFPVLIVDEAQDMTAVQHKIIDHLVGSGHENVVLVGDQYQAIYEWNTARPKFFVDKIQNEKIWRTTSISSTFRCSPAISSAVSSLAREGEQFVVDDRGKNRHYGEPVEVRGYASGDEASTVNDVIDSMAATLSGTEPHTRQDGDRKTIAVVARSNPRLATLRQFITGSAAALKEPIVWVNKSTRDYLRVIHYSLKEDINGAIEAYETLLWNIGSYGSLAEMRAQLAESWGKTRVGYRVALYSEVRKIIDHGGPISDLLVSRCADYCASEHVGIPPSVMAAARKECDALGVGAKKGDVPLSTLFMSHEDRVYLPHASVGDVRLLFSTVHGVKGETYDGVLLYVGDRSSSCNCTIPKAKWIDILTHPLVDCEQKRIVYVALSRAAQMLGVVAPVASLAGWRSALNVEQAARSV